MPAHVHLLIIDAQNDFCDLPETWCPVDGASGQRLAPALPVPGAHADMLRLAHLITHAGPWLSELTTTFDSHHRVDIAHPPYWQQADGSAVAPFTPITLADLDAGRYLPRNPGQRAATRAYLVALASRGRYTLMVWPLHCQMGSWGHGLHPAVLAACSGWQDRSLQPMQVVHKGEHPLTEHYSALEAEVPDPAAPGTQLNRALLQRLAQADTILVAGEAASHCVRATVEHLLAHLPPGRPERLLLLSDAMSPVAGFEADAAAFAAAMAARGVRSATCAHWLAAAG